MSHARWSGLGCRSMMACGALALILSPTAVSAQDLIYNPTITSNGYRIYISPARHSDAGGRGECLNLNENDIAYWNARLSAYGDFSAYGVHNFTQRGYTVRVGTGTIQSAINNSNTWGSHRHIPLHSNASSLGCASTDATRHGTVVIYRSGSTNGQALADRLRNWVGTGGTGSPGTNDYICYNPGHPCTTIDLGELRDTAMPAAYVEADFHSWNRGADWLWNVAWSWRIAAGVDEHLGYPRR
jgi:hypothetical protein